jgi:hypothetical protein
VSSLGSTTRRQERRGSRSKTTAGSGGQRARARPGTEIGRRDKGGEVRA